MLIKVWNIKFFSNEKLYQNTYNFLQILIYNIIKMLENYKYNTQKFFNNVRIIQQVQFHRELIQNTNIHSSIDLNSYWRSNIEKLIKFQNKTILSLHNNYFRKTIPTNSRSLISGIVYRKYWTKRHRQSQTRTACHCLIIKKFISHNYWYFLLFVVWPGFHPVHSENGCELPLILILESYGPETLC